MSNVMQSVLFNPNLSDFDRRSSLFTGNLIVLGASKASRELCQHAVDMIKNAFSSLNPEHAQESLDVPEFVEIVGPLKSKFTNDRVTKELVRAYLEERGCDPSETFFDVPRLRIVPHSGYLSAGVSYAYKPHRDIWYSSPRSQINWWLPVYEVTPERSMPFYPKYWSNGVSNTSSEFDYEEWKCVGRNLAAQQIKQDARKHPVPLVDLPNSEELRLSAAPGDCLLFSASQLHATAPNLSNATRFSIDFRTVNLTDLRNGRGGLNVDSEAKGTTIHDFISAKDFSSISSFVDTL